MLQLILKMVKQGLLLTVTTLKVFFYGFAIPFC